MTAHDTALAVIASRREGLAEERASAKRANRLLHPAWRDLVLDLIAREERWLDHAEEALLRHQVTPGTDHCHYCWDGPRRGIATRDTWHPCPEARSIYTALGVDADE